MKRSTGERAEPVGTPNDAEGASFVWPPVGEDGSTRGRLVITSREPEPRVFTLLWSLYLLSAAGVTIFSVQRTITPDSTIFRPASKLLVVMVGVGIGLLWPMFRLSQGRSRRWIEGTPSDLLAIGLTVNALLWPLTWLGGWTMWITLWLAASMGCWAACFGGLIELGQRWGTGFGRAAVMLVCVGLTFGAPLWWWFNGTVGGDWSWRLASPVTSVYGMAHAESGLTARMTFEKWAGVWGPAAFAAVVWGAAVLAGGIRGGRDR